MKLESHFGEDVILTGIREKRNVVTSSSWTQFIGNNMDHQVRTLDDAGTFHWDGHSELWMGLEHSMGWAFKTLDGAGTFHGMGIQNTGWGWNIP